MVFEMFLLDAQKHTYTHSAERHTCERARAHFPVGACKHCHVSTKMAIISTPVRILRRRERNSLALCQCSEQKPCTQIQLCSILKLVFQFLLLFFIFFRTLFLQNPVYTLRYFQVFQRRSMFSLSFVIFALISRSWKKCKKFFLALFFSFKIIHSIVTGRETPAQFLHTLYVEHRHKHSHSHVSIHKSR